MPADTDPWRGQLLLPSGGGARRRARRAPSHCTARAGPLDARSRCGGNVPCRPSLVMGTRAPAPGAGWTGGEGQRGVAGCTAKGLLFEWDLGPESSCVDARGSWGLGDPEQAEAPLAGAEGVGVGQASEPQRALLGPWPRTGSRLTALGRSRQDSAGWMRGSSRRTSPTLGQVVLLALLWQEGAGRRVGGVLSLGTRSSRGPSPGLVDRKSSTRSSVRGRAAPL